MPTFPNVPQEQHVPKLKDYLPYLNKRGGAVAGSTPSLPFNMYPTLQPNAIPNQMPFVPESTRQTTLGAPVLEVDRSLKPSPTDTLKHDEKFDVSSMGIRPAPVGSEQTSVPAMCSTALPSVGGQQLNPYASVQQPWNFATSIPSNVPYNNSHVSPQYSTQNVMHQSVNKTNQLPASSNVTNDPASNIAHSYSSAVASTNSYSNQNYTYPPQASTAGLPQNFLPPSAYPSSGAQPPYLQSAVTHSGVNSVSPASEQRPAELNTGYAISSNNMPNSASPMPSGSFYPPNVAPGSMYAASSSLPSHSINSANSEISHSAVYPQRSMVQPSPSLAPSSLHQFNPAFASQSATPTVPQGSAQAVPSAQFPTSMAYPNSLNYPMSGVQGSTTSSVPYSSVPPNSAVMSQNNYVAPYSTMIDKGPVKAGGVSSVPNIPNAPVNMPSYPSSLPHTINQQNAFTSSVSGVGQQSQQYPAWPNSSVPQYSATNYMGQSNPYNASNMSNVQYNPSMQYYQSSVVPIQAKQASVTASMDTKTSTFNSLNPYAVAESNVNQYVGHTVNGYAPNFLKTANIANPGPFQSQTNNPAPNQTQNVSGAPVGNIFPQNNINVNPSVYSSVPSGVYTSTSCTSQVPSTSYVSNLSIPNSAPNASVLQNQVHYSATVNMHSNAGVSNSQSYQESLSAADNFSCINAAYGSSPNIPNQHLQSPMEPKPLAPAQPTVASSPKRDKDSQNSTAKSLPKSSSADLQTHRDFITPPPDSAAANEVEKETTPVLQPKV